MSNVAAFWALADNDFFLCKTHIRFSYKSFAEGKSIISMIVKQKRRTEVDKMFWENYCSKWIVWHEMKHEILFTWNWLRPELTFLGLTRCLYVHLFGMQRKKIIVQEARNWDFAVILLSNLTSLEKLKSMNWIEPNLYRGRKSTSWADALSSQLVFMWAWF